jgi:hypothetical protein
MMNAPAWRMDHTGGAREESRSLIETHLEMTDPALTLVDLSAREGGSRHVPDLGARRLLCTRRRLLAGLLVAALPCPRTFASSAKGAALVLPSVWSNAIDPTPYLVSEKYDGVRGYWDGAQLRFKSGRVVPAPAWFTSRLPKQPLDGELWLGRGRFDELSGIVRTGLDRTTAQIDADWRRVF